MAGKKGIEKGKGVGVIEATTANNKCCLCGRPGSSGIVTGRNETAWYCIIHLNQMQVVTASSTGLPDIKYPNVLGNLVESTARRR